MKVGDKVSYQCAGMKEPEYGTVSGIPDLDHGLFVQFEGQTRSVFMPRMFLRAGHVPGWWKNDEFGGWRSTE